MDSFDPPCESQPALNTEILTPPNQDPDLHHASDS